METAAASTSLCPRFLYSDGAKWGVLRRSCWVLHSTSMPRASRSSSHRDLGREAMLQGNDWEQLLRGHTPVLPISELCAGTLWVPAASSFLYGKAPGDPQVLTHHRDEARLKSHRAQAQLSAAPLQEQLHSRTCTETPEPAYPFHTAAIRGLSGQFYTQLEAATFKKRAQSLGVQGAAARLRVLLHRCSAVQPARGSAGLLKCLIRLY